MAKSAVLDWQQSELGFQSLVLACLASVVLLREDALAGGDTRREVATTVATVDIARK
jgi:hypothetical protein